MPSKITVLQALSSQVNPHLPKHYIPGAQPGLLLKDGTELLESVEFQVASVDLRTITFEDAPPLLRVTEYIVYIGTDGTEIWQRPLTAFVTGPLEIGKTYRLSTELQKHGKQTFYALKAELAGE